MPPVKIVAIQRLNAADRERITAIDPAVQLIDAGGWFDGEIRETWPAFATARYLGRNSSGTDYIETACADGKREHSQRCRRETGFSRHPGATARDADAD